MFLLTEVKPDSKYFLRLGVETGPNIITKELGWSKIERNVDRLREERGKRGWWDWTGNY